MGFSQEKGRKFINEDNIISIEQAIKANTSMPANMIGLKDRATLKIGQVSDIVVFNPETIRDNTTFAESQQ